MEAFKWHCALCAWKEAHPEELESPRPIYPPLTLTMEQPPQPSAEDKEQPERPPSPSGYTKQRYAPRQPIEPLYGLSCCLLQYLQVLPTKDVLDTPEGLFSTLPYRNVVRTNVYKSWSPDINRACGFENLTNLACIQIVIATSTYAPSLPRLPVVFIYPTIRFAPGDMLLIFYSKTFRADRIRNSTPLHL